MHTDNVKKEEQTSCPNNERLYSLGGLQHSSETQLGRPFNKGNDYEKQKKTKKKLNTHHDYPENHNCKCLIK